ncbi:MAG: T9SS type A sorting domain-containing protein [Bacteroidales bacterium]|nr:T9SS type A sorting domain-containing protein [Bacteroidales bacterium]
MKTIYTLIFLVLALSLNTQAQYVTPGNGDDYSLDDLVDQSGGVVSFNNGTYFINGALTISATDTLKILDAAVVRIAAGIRPEFLGSFISNPQNGEVVITAIDTLTSGQEFKGLRFEDSPANYFANTRITHSGGLQFIGSEVSFEYCTFIHNSSANTSNVINYSNCHPIIRYCRFVENARSAIGSGANTEGSPQIMYNEFIGNTTDNSNRPQINLGPGATDTIYIVGNYVEGVNDNVGGISVNSLVGVGDTKVVISDNIIINNRYGYAQIGSNISSRVTDNIILDNNIQNDPMLGGSGLNFNGSELSNKAIVCRNIIAGNLWGITTQQIVDIDLGTAMEPGGNVFYDNENGGQTYAFYNNTPEAVSAIGNYWGTNDVAVAETYIFHQPDDPTLGLVTYEPIKTLLPEFISFALLAENNPQLEMDIIGQIDVDELEVTLEVPGGISLENLIPTYIVELGVMGDPESEVAQDFSSDVIYNLETPHGEAAEWTVIANQQAQTFDLTFVVTDEENVPIAGAEITLEGFDMQETNDSGITVFEALEPGTYTYEVNVAAYEAVNGSISITEENITETVIMDIFVGLAEASPEQLRVYPNPAEDLLNLENLPNEISYIRILDLQGRMVFEQQNFNFSSLNISQLKSGCYIISVNNSTNLYQSKFIKQ